MITYRLETTKKIRPKRKHTTRSRNPLKDMNVEVKSEYEEVSRGFAEQEMKRMKKEASKYMCTHICL